MKRWAVKRRGGRVTLGIYQGESAGEVLDRLARVAGYDNHAEALRVAEALEAACPHLAPVEAQLLTVEELEGSGGVVHPIGRGIVHAMMVHARELAAAHVEDVEEGAEEGER